MPLIEEPWTKQIIGAAIDVHRQLGPGLLESAYEHCLAYELQLRGLSFQRQLNVPVIYKGIRLDCGYCIDLLVADAVIVELKAVEKLLPVHEAQLLTYMKLMKKRFGLLINFNAPVVSRAILRRVL